MARVHEASIDIHMLNELVKKDLVCWLRSDFVGEPGLNQAVSGSIGVELLAL